MAVLQDIDSAISGLSTCSTCGDELTTKLYTVREKYVTSSCGSGASCAAAPLTYLTVPSTESVVLQRTKPDPVVYLAAEVVQPIELELQCSTLIEQISGYGVQFSDLATEQREVCVATCGCESLTAQLMAANQPAGVKLLATCDAAPTAAQRLVVVQNILKAKISPEAESIIYNAAAKNVYELVDEVRRHLTSLPPARVASSQSRSPAPRALPPRSSAPPRRATSVTPPPRRLRTRSSAPSLSSARADRPATRPTWQSPVSTR